MCAASRRRKVAFQVMASRGLRFSFLIVFVISFRGFILQFGGGFLGSAFGQEPDRNTIHSALEQREAVRPYLRDQWSWNQRGRGVARRESAAGLRFRAYQQKMAMRAQRAAARLSASSFTDPPERKSDGAPASSSNSGSAVWVPLGPAPLASDANYDLHRDGGRNCGRLQFRRARGGDG